MYFRTYLRILGSRRVNTRLSGSQSTATQTLKPHFVFVCKTNKSLDYGRKSGIRLGEWFELWKFELRGAFCKGLTRNSDGA